MYSIRTIAFIELYHRAPAFVRFSSVHMGSCPYRIDGLHVHANTFIKFSHLVRFKSNQFCIFLCFHLIHSVFLSKDSCCSLMLIFSRIAMYSQCSCTYQSFVSRFLSLSLPPRMYVRLSQYSPSRYATERKIPK